MVRAANVKRAAAEKRFKEANNKVGGVLMRILSLTALVHMQRQL